MIDQNTVWIKKYQPTTIEDYVFNNDQHKQLVEKWLSQGRIDGNLICSGPAGTGKTSLLEILIKHIIKTQSDLFRMKSRSVAEIDELKNWVGKAPNRSTHNIVYIEEIDKLSKQAQVTLKDGMLEKHVETCIFLCATNHPRKIDPALFSRFTYKFVLDSFDKDNLYNQIDRILKLEEAEFDPDQLKIYVENNYQKGLRDILNQLQISYITNQKKISFEDLAGSSEIEDSVISLFLIITKSILKMTNSKFKKQCLHFPTNSVIAQDYVNLVTLLNNNWDVDFDLVFEELITNIDLLPAKSILIRYYESIEDKKYPYLHLISCLYDVMESCCTAQL
jgi:DNA polymerase III gamma/tau subunit